MNTLQNIHFTDAEQMAITTAITTLENVLSDKVINLSPDERQRYGSINEQNKLFVNKVRDYYNAQPQLGSPDVDWADYSSSFEVRDFIQGILQRIENLKNGINNVRITHDYNNYQSALTDYSYTKYKNSTTATGYESKTNDLKQFFEKTTNTFGNTEV